MKLEDLGSNISDHQFMIHILNNMNYDDNLQLGAMMHKLLNHKIKMLTIDEIQDNHKLRLEHLNMKYNFKIAD
jgi:hypothetical protein